MPKQKQANIVKTANGFGIEVGGAVIRDGFCNPALAVL